MFVVTPNARDPSKHDVIRMVPEVVCAELKPNEAKTLAAALNAELQARLQK